MAGQQRRFGALIARVTLAAAATVAAAVLLAPAAAATPESDADSAITAAWKDAGGPSSALGDKQGDVYPVGDGFAQDFAGGKMFFTPATGAKAVYGAILDKYESLGGPVGGDLGFPASNEVPGLTGPDSRVSTFSASDKPVIFWTLDHGAFVVRAAINAAWDKLGSSGGALGAPVGDETYDGEVVTQPFNGGKVSWNRLTKVFTTTPPDLAQQMTDLQITLDPTAAINMAWRAAGGARGPLGARQGRQYPVGADGLGQNFAGGKVFFSPATGANAVETQVLAKYESLGGPIGSDLGFPTANETDGGIPRSRISTFSAADKPVIFWTHNHGAFVVRGAMKVAWGKLGGVKGKLGPPAGDQAVNDEIVKQEFAGGKISWDRAKNAFTTQPSNLASSLSGLQVPGQKQPSRSAAAGGANKSAWHWWLLAAIPVLLIVGMVALTRRQPWEAGTAADLGALGAATGLGAAGAVTGEPHADHAGPDFREEVEEEDPDAVDTAPTRIPSAADLSGGWYASTGTNADAEAHPAEPGPRGPAQPAIHLPLDDPYEVPDGYPVKANTSFGLYYTPGSAQYEDTLAEIWFVSEEAAQANGFNKAG